MSSHDSPQPTQPMTQRRKYPDWQEPGLTVLQQVMRYQQLTAERLARGAGVPVSTTYRILDGKLPTLENAIRIARYLKVRVEDIWNDRVQ